MKLITDRSKDNVSRLGELSQKRWDSMTEYEKAEWSGNPLTAAVYGYQDGVNLIPPSGTGVNFRDGSIVAEGNGTIVIGSAADFSNATVTLSAEFVLPGGELSLSWSDGMDAGIVLTAAGAVTEVIPESENTQLILHVSAGYYGKVMLELGRIRHAYTPYTEIIATASTKGAYNYSDFNRVERAVQEISELLDIALTTKTDWNVWDIPTNSDVARYLNNIRQLQDICGETTMLPENLNKLTHSTANTIESALLRCRNIAESALRCGELICGEVI